jgi:hypothetical protein
MLVQNVLAVFLLQAEARNRALLAGLLDCLMWPAGMGPDHDHRDRAAGPPRRAERRGDRGGHAGQLRRLLGCGEAGQAVHQGAASMEQYCHQRGARRTW